MNIRASGINRQRREAVDSPQIDIFQKELHVWRTERALHPGQPSAPAHEMQSTPLPAAMMTDENARCNRAAMSGAGPAHSEPHDDAECRPIERNPDPPAALLHVPVACNL